MPGWQEFFVIAVVVLLVFGPDRLPEVVRTVVQGIQRFRSLTQHGVEELKRVAEVEELNRDLQQLRSELQQTRDSVTRSLSEPSRPAAQARPAAVPPPVDPEAT